MPCAAAIRNAEIRQVKNKAVYAALKASPLRVPVRFWGFGLPTSEWSQILDCRPWMRSKNRGLEDILHCRR